MIARVVKDTATPFVRKLVTELGQKPRDLNAVVGSACTDATKGHFYELNRNRHRSPNKTIGFYARCAQSTSFVADDKGATISTNEVGAAQRFRGGPIEPSFPPNYLTIPAKDDMLDVSARSHTDLVVLYGRFGPFGLGRVPAENWVPKSLENYRQRVYNLEPGDERPEPPAITRLKRPRQEGSEVLYWLTQHVNQKPDDTVLPTEKVLGDAAVDALQEYINAIEGRK